MTPTPFPPGVTADDLNNYILLFRGQDAIVALFFGAGLFGWLASMIVGRRVRRRL